MHQNSIKFLKQIRDDWSKQNIGALLSVIKPIKKRYYYTGYECNKNNTQLEIIEHIHNLKAKKWK